MSGTPRADDGGFVAAADRGDDDADSALVEDGTVDEAAVKAVANELFDRWDRERVLDAVRERVRNVASLSGAVVLLGWFVDVDGLAGVLLELWFFASLPIFVVAGAVYATLRDPRNASEVWWDDGAIVAFGTLALAALARSADRSPAGRVAYQVLLGDGAPGGDRGYDAPDAVDERRVRELRRYLRYAVVGSVAAAAIDVGARVYEGDLATAVVELLAALADGSGGGSGGGGGPLLPSVPALPTDPLSIAGLVVLAVVVGSIIGLVVGLRREL